MTLNRSTMLPAMLAALAGCAGARSEDTVLDNRVQLTFPDRFTKAGEAYFSPDGRRVVFQAVEAPASGSDPYAMFVADLATGIQDDILVQYVMQIQGQLGVSVNETALRTVTGGDPGN